MKRLKTKDRKRKTVHCSPNCCLNTVHYADSDCNFDLAFLHQCCVRRSGVLEHRVLFCCRIRVSCTPVAFGVILQRELTGLVLRPGHSNRSCDLKLKRQGANQTTGTPALQPRIRVDGALICKVERQFGGDCVISCQLCNQTTAHP